MAPTLTDGEVVLVRRRSGRQYKRGDVVVFRLAEHAATHESSPEDPAYRIKRVAAVSGESVPAWLRAAGADGDKRQVPTDCLVVSGDAERSQDSRQLGYIHVGDVLGAVVRKLGRRRPPPRDGLTTRILR